MSEKKEAKQLHATVINHTLAIKTFKPNPDLELVVLRPGANVVSPEVAAIIKAHPILKLEIEAGGLEIVAEHEVGGEKVVLSKMKPKEAIEVAGKTIDKALLSTWLAEEKRQAVKEAIQKQLEELGSPIEYRKTSSAE